MAYHLKIGNTDIRMDVDAADQDGLTAVIGEKKYRVGYEAISENRLFLTVDDGKEKTAIQAYIAETTDGKLIHINGNSYLVSDADVLSRQQTRKSGGAGLPDQMTPATPAVVTAVLVRVGDPVKKGQGVAVVPAMKMETTLMAPYDGKVVKINAAEGDKVAPGDILMEIEKTEDSN